MNRIFISCLSLFLITVAPVQAAWIQKDFGMIQGLRGFTQVGDQFFAVGNGGNILVSTDGGATWTVKDKNANVYWQDVDVVDQKIRVLGENGSLRESSDGGNTWESIGLGVSQTIYDLDTKGQYGYLVGENGRIMTLQSSANQWIIEDSPTTLTLNRVHNLGNGTAWIVGQQGTLIQTPDYGITWIHKGAAASTELFGVWFKSSTTGYIIGQNGTFRKTTDAGVSWVDVAVSGLSSQTLYDIRGSGDRMIAVGDKVILDSTDGGATWTATSYATENYRFYDAYFDSAGNIWVVGTQDDVKSVILKYESVIASPAQPDEAISPSPSPSTSSGDNSMIEAQPNSLIKLACTAQAPANDPCKAVYFYGSDGKRHAFPNEKVFFTWYDNFDSVVNVSAGFMSSLSLGKNVTYHPGTRMVKFQSVPTVYAVSKGGVLRAIGSEQVAKDLYGTDWNKKIDDIQDAFYGNYTFGTKIEKASDYDVVAEKSSVTGLDQNF